MVTDLETIIADYSEEKIWGVWKYKRYTPYEMSSPAPDEKTEEFAGDFRLVSAIELPNKDVLLGLKRVWVEDKYNVEEKLYTSELELADEIEYHKMSDISGLVDKTKSEEYKDFIKDEV